MEGVNIGQSAVDKISVTGTVIDVVGEPFTVERRANISIGAIDFESTTMTMSWDGSFKFHDIPSGAYTIEASWSAACTECSQPPPVITTSKQITVLDNQTANITLILNIQ